MDKEAYQTTLLAILRDHSDAAIAKLQAIDRDLPDKARKIHLVIHPAQDPDGMFDVMAHLEGPDLHVLNKAIADHRTLFTVRFVNGKLTPAVPQFDPFDAPFSVNDAIVDSAMVWVREVWVAAGGLRGRLPAVVQGGDGYGTVPIMTLTP